MSSTKVYQTYYIFDEKLLKMIRSFVFEEDGGLGWKSFLRCLNFFGLHKKCSIFLVLVFKPMKKFVGDSAFGEIEGFIGERPGRPISRHIAAAQNLVINVPLCLLYLLTRLIALAKQLRYWMAIIEIRNTRQVRRFSNV